MREVEPLLLGSRRSGGGPSAVVGGNVLSALVGSVFAYLIRTHGSPRKNPKAPPGINQSMCSRQSLHQPVADHGISRVAGCYN